MLSRIESLIASCRTGWSLPGEFYSDEEIYQLDLQSIWRRGWLFAGHSCEIPNAGDYFTLRVDKDSIIVIRSSEGIVRAFYNVCRHRGSLVGTRPGPRVRPVADGACRMVAGRSSDVRHSPFGG